MAIAVVFDFDSTIITIESLDALIINQNLQAKAEIEAITNAGMGGSLPLEQSILNRLALVTITQPDIADFTANLANYLSFGIADFIAENQKTQDIEFFIISGGIIEIIAPIAKTLGIASNNCYANKAIYNEKQELIALDKDNPLLYNGGKAKVIASEIINKRGFGENKIIMIGDGYTDYEVSLALPNVHFIGFGCNVVRQKVKENSQYFAKDFQEFRQFYQKIIAEINGK
jgi:HAD superfamily phosphoserine phosphatase-like hydrolase